jgi:Domain of unknown function (DUF1877)
MSMICNLLGLTPAQIAALQAEPSLAAKVVTAVQDAHLSGLRAEMLSRMPPERKQFEAKQAEFEASSAMRSFKAKTEEARNLVATIGPFEEPLSLEKSWHMLHYLFTGHIGPANAPGDLLMTGDVIGEDLAYGPARLHGSARTRQFSEFLEEQDLARLQARINIEEMKHARVYAMPIGRGSAAEHEGELRNEIGLFFPRLRDHVRAMSGKGNGLLIWVF